MTALHVETSNGINGNQADRAPQNTARGNGHMNGAAAGPTPPEFRFNDRGVRTAMRWGYLWFVAADICALVDCRHPKKEVARLPAEEKGIALAQTACGPRKMSIVNETGLCTIVATSFSPSAPAVMQWVTQDLFPAAHEWVETTKRPLGTVTQLAAGSNGAHASAMEQWQHSGEAGINAVGLRLEFDYRGRRLHVFIWEDGPWFVVGELCEMLSHTGANKAALRLPAGEKATASVRTPDGGARRVIVNEDGLFRLLGTSRKPEASAVRKWVMDEVLPTVRDQLPSSRQRLLTTVPQNSSTNGAAPSHDHQGEQAMRPDAGHGLAATPAVTEFRFRGRPVQTIVQNDEVWVAADDICALLGRSLDESIEVFRKHEMGLLWTRLPRESRKRVIVRADQVFRLHEMFATPRPTLFMNGSPTRSGRPPVRKPLARECVR